MAVPLHARGVILGHELHGWGRRLGLGGRLDMRLEWVRALHCLVMIDQGRVWPIQALVGCWVGSVMGGRWGHKAPMLLLVPIGHEGLLLCQADRRLLCKACKNIKGLHSQTQQVSEYA